jgi:heme/copper-type cytochrome/quinol oxidase subunit 2
MVMMIMIMIMMTMMVMMTMMMMIMSVMMMMILHRSAAKGADPAAALHTKLTQLVNAAPVVLFMKGSPRSVDEIDSVDQVTGCCIHLDRKRCYDWVLHTS